MKWGVFHEMYGRSSPFSAWVLLYNDFLDIGM